MICPYCEEGETRVVDSREHDNLPSVRRRRECPDCQKRFTTYERYEMELSVVKRDGRKEEFSRDKLKMGMVKACNKRPINLDTIDHVVNKIENKLRTRNGDVTSEIIGNMVMQELKKIDKVAYIRFASVYRDFDDVKSFEEEVKLLTH
mgnify:CR=1 FL=1